MTDPTDRGPVFREAEARQVLRRAAELDAEGAGALDAAALRDAAAQAGISAAAVERALREHEEQGERERAPAPVRGRPLWRHPAVVSAGAAALTLLAWALLRG